MSGTQIAIDFVIKDNNVADMDAKKTSDCQVEVIAPMVLIQLQPSEDDIAHIQHQPDTYE